MPLRYGHRFWSTQAEMFRHAKNAQILIKYDLYEFTFFDNFDFFLEWFQNYRHDCIKSKRPFAIYELLTTGKDMCFVCDIEVYCPLEIHETDFQQLQFTLRKNFREIYGRYGDANNVIFMEDHRPSSHRIEKTGDKTPMMKLSYHALGLSEIFNEMHKTCEMKKLAARVNKDLVAEMTPLNSKYGVVMPKGDILDMGIYTKNRALRTIKGQKDVKSEGFKMSDCSTHMMIKNCFVTRIICDKEKVYYKLAEEYRVAHEESAKNVTHRTTPVKTKSPRDKTETLEIERKIKNYLHETFNDNISVKSNGLFGTRESFEVRGHRHCPICEEEHMNNGAYINDIGAGNFQYLCLASTGKKTYSFRLEEVSESKSIRKDIQYLESFADVRSKVISISAPMGTGKTYQIKNYLKQFPTDTKVLFITCRKGMAKSIGGRFEGFEVYIDKTNQPLQVQEYESLHRITTNYNIIIMDEIRSMLTSAACFETNGINLTTNMEKLQELCEVADHVICADADLHIDGCVQDFYKHTFDDSQIHHINHTSGGQELNYLFATQGGFIERIQNDLKAGKKIMVCCGSSKELKALREIALEIVQESEIGIYYADSEKQNELVDVYKHWPAYKFIGFTSTITVSIDYTNPVDTVYISPCTTTCGPRDMNQMKSRARNITSKTVIVKYNQRRDGSIIPLDVDMDALKNQELNMVMNRRKAMTRFVNSYDREFYGTIFKVGAGHRAKFFTSVLTDMWIWARTEEYIKRTNWLQYFLLILEKKGYKWITKVIKSKEEKNYGKIMDEKKENVTKTNTDIMKKVDVFGMTKEAYKTLMLRKIHGNASQEDLAKIQKYQVQQYYEKKVDVDFIIFFNKHKRAIFNQTFTMRFPQEVRRKIHSNIMIMKDSLDTVDADVKIILGIEKTLRLLGFKSATDNDTRVDFNKVSQDALQSMYEVLELVKAVKLERRPRSENPLTCFKSHIGTFMGLHLEYHQVQRKGVSSAVYSLENIIDQEFIDNKLYGEQWLEDHCNNFDAYKKNPRGTERRAIVEYIKGKLKSDFWSDIANTGGGLQDDGRDRGKERDERTRLDNETWKDYEKKRKMNELSSVSLKKPKTKHVVKNSLDEQTQERLREWKENMKNIAFRDEEFLRMRKERFPELK